MPLTPDTLRPLILQAPDQLPTALGMARPGGLRVAALKPPTCILGGHPDRCPGVLAGVRDRMADTHHHKADTLRPMVARPEATVAELLLTPDSTPDSTPDTLDTPGTQATPVMPDTLAPSEILPVLTRRPVMVACRVACTTKKLKRSLLRLRPFDGFFFLSDMICKKSPIMKFFANPFFCKTIFKLYYYGKVRGAVSRACLTFFPFA